MVILLVAINAKYIQSNLAVRLLRAYAEANLPAPADGGVSIRVAEWNINQPVSSVVRGIYESGPDAVLFSTYVWNRRMVFDVAAEVRKVLPRALIGCGGPEVSWAPGKVFDECPEMDVILEGEGELTFTEFAKALALVPMIEPSGGLARTPDFSGIAGLYSRMSDGTIVFGGKRSPITDLGIIPFPWSPERLDIDPRTKIVYYESSRGCPFSCAYCLSSIDKTVRYYPLERVLREIGYFIEAGFPLVKFVDRTFNLDPDRYLSIWRYIRDRHTGNTLFHFEIAAEYLTEDAFALLETMPEGAIQFEIGIQSINAATLAAVGRPARPERLADNIRRIPPAIHTHVDLIAGLPEENLSSFARSFDYAFGLHAGMLQLGFLKILSGSPMETLARGDPGYAWSSAPPYEVLSSPALSYGDLLTIKDVEHVLDSWYNSGLLRRTLNRLVALASARTPEIGTPAFRVFCEAARHIRAFFPDGDLFLPRRPADSFSCAAAWLAGDHPAGGLTDARGAALAREELRFDFLLQGKPGRFPDWYERRYSKEAHDRALHERAGDLAAAGCAPDAADMPLSRRVLYGRTEYDEFALDPDGRLSAFLFAYPEDSRKKKAFFFDLTYT